MISHFKKWNVFKDGNARKYINELGIQLKHYSTQQSLLNNLLIVDSIISGFNCLPIG